MSKYSRVQLSTSSLTFESKWRSTSYTLHVFLLNITPIVNNPTQEAPMPFGVQSGPGPEPNPDHDSSPSDVDDSDDDDKIPPLADSETEDSSDDSDEEEPQPQAEP
jgi:hypothetical protein